MGSRKEGDRVGQVTGGVVMVTLGVLFLSGELGIANIHIMWRYWPIVLIVIGLAHLALGRGDDRYGSGFTNLLLGLVFLAINFHWMDLGWGTGWPLVLVAVGAGMMLKALFTPRRPKRRDDSGATVAEEERHA